MERSKHVVGELEPLRYHQQHAQADARAAVWREVRLLIPAGRPWHLTAVPSSFSRSPLIPTDIELLLFDLGGVLVDFSGPRDLAAFMRTPAAPTEILKKWGACPHTTAYEGGQLSAKEWAERFVRDWDLDLSPNRFLTEFRSWSRGFFPGAQELLAELRPRYRLAALSNSNALHWKRNEELRIPDEFEFAIASHEVGCCKPEAAIFKAVLDRARLPPDRVVFFDDLPANVAGAAACGIHACQVEGVDGLRRCLITQGLLI